MCVLHPPHILLMWLFPLAPTPVAQCSGHGGLGEARPPKCPQLHSHPCRMWLCQVWFPVLQSAPALGRREVKTGCSQGTQLASKACRSAPFRASHLTPLVFLGGSGRRSLGTLLQWVLPRALQLSPCSQTQSQATAWQSENSIQAGREPCVMCWMTQTFPHSAVAWPKYQAGTCASSCLVATCPQALLSRMAATKCPQLQSPCPTQLWHTGE